MPGFDAAAALGRLPFGLAFAACGRRMGWNLRAVKGVNECPQKIPLVEMQLRDLERRLSLL